MIHIRRNNNDKLYNGFNFYSLSDKHSFGFLFRYGRRIPIVELGSKVFCFRYSKEAKKWFIGKLENRDLSGI